MRPLAAAPAPSNDRLRRSTALAAVLMLAAGGMAASAPPAHAAEGPEPAPPWELVTHTVLTDDPVYDVAVAPDGQTVYAVSPGGEDGDGTLFAVDPATTEVLWSVPLPLGPASLAVSRDGSTIFVGQQGGEDSDGWLTAVEASGEHTVTPVPDYDLLGFGPTALALSADGSEVYALEAQWILAFDVETLEYTDMAYPGIYMADFAASTQHDEIYTVAPFEDDLSRVDFETGIPTKLTIGYGASGVALSPDESLVWAAMSDDNQVAVIDTANLTVANTIAVGEYPMGLEVAPDGSRVIVANNWSWDETSEASTVTIIDTATMTTYDVPVGEAPLNVAFAPDSSAAYVANADGTLSVLAPPAPAPVTDVTVVPGARQAFVSWEPSPSAGDGASVTYTATAAPGEATCTTTETSCFLVGLPAGEVTVSVVATASGATSAAASSAPTMIVDDPASEELPSSTPGADITVTDADGTALTTVRQGQAVDVTASGFAPHTNVDVHFYSSPVRLGTGVTNAAGSVTITVHIPTSAALAPHHLVASGFAANGAHRYAVIPVTAVSGLAATGDDPTSSMALAGGLLGGGLLLLLGVGLLRRRPAHASRAVTHMDA